MHGAVTELTGIAIVTAVAVLLGLVFVRLRQPAIVGYILAGIVLGPTGLGLVSETEEIRLLAELGVIMLLFLIGMELSVRAFVLVLRPATLTAIAQIAVALMFTFLFAAIFGWSTKQAVLLAFIVAVSSTAVAMRMLDEIGELRSETGRITVGVLIAQDIAIVPMLIIVNSFSETGADITEISLKLVLAVIVLVLIFRVLTRRGKLTLPFTRGLHGRVDLIALASIAFCFGAAAITSLAGLSAAFGAFIAGLVIANSTLRSEAIHVSEPIQAVLVVIFFLSIGLLIDLDYVLANIWTVVLFLVGVLIAKSALNVAILHAVGEPWERAFPAGLIMAQIGEFSFVLATVGFANSMIDADGYRLALAVIALSLLISPFWMVSVRRFDDVARHGVTDFRAALSEVYAGELHELERGARLFRKGGLAVARRGRAARIAWQRNKARRTVAKSGNPSAKEVVADPRTAATADAYPPEDAETQTKAGRPGRRRPKGK